VISFSGLCHGFADWNGLGRARARVGQPLFGAGLLTSARAFETAAQYVKVPFDRLRATLRTGFSPAGASMY